ncbi:MAG TPA: VWA domain-containing protein, partial [Campylobacterales bacterium]|nr:VWA domain-containing protein [Campylobacterales bacterium]
MKIWMRGGDGGKDSGGFKIVKTKLASVDSSILNAVKNISAFKYDSTVNFRKFYEEEANFTGRHFYSEDSISLNGGTLGGYSSYAPNGNDVTPYTGDNSGFITSNSTELVTGHTRLAMMQKSKIPFKDYWYSMVIDGNQGALVDNGINLIPRAIANAEGFINYFFRGRLKATLSDGNLTITNISNPDLVADANIVTFKTDGKFNVYYETDNNETKFLKQCSLTNPLSVNDSVPCEISTEFESKKSEMGKEQKLTVIYEGGTIGNEYGVSVAIVKKLANADLLFSFDKSGSMGSDIENAKNSAKSILDDVIGIDNNSTFIEVEAFNGSAGVLLAYDNNITKAKDTISTIYSGGGTALYDAIKLAGDNAVSHKNSSGISKSIVILYTDGQENSSSTSRQGAI